MSYVLDYAALRDREATSVFGAEHVLLAHARERSLRVVGLESYEEHFAVLADLSDSEQIAWLEGTLEDLEDPRATDRLREQLAAWTNGDVAAMERWLAKLRADPRIPQRRLIDDRNVRMLERSIEHMHRGPTFIAVGAFHVIGARGMVRMLRDRGYTLVALAAGCGLGAPGCGLAGAAEPGGPRVSPRAQ